MAIQASEISFNEAVLRLAVVHNKTVEFRYAKAHGDVIETRRLEPQSININMNGDQSFIGYDPYREDARQFRVDRIKGEVRFV